MICLLEKSTTYDVSKEFVEDCNHELEPHFFIKYGLVFIDWTCKGCGGIITQLVGEAKNPRELHPFEFKQLLKNGTLSS